MLRSSSAPIGCSRAPVLAEFLLGSLCFAAFEAALRFGCGVCGRRIRLILSPWRMLRRWLRVAFTQNARSRNGKTGKTYCAVSPYWKFAAHHLIGVPNRAFDDFAAG